MESKQKVTEPERNSALFKAESLHSTGMQHVEHQTNWDLICRGGGGGGGGGKGGGDSPEGQNLMCAYVN